MIEKIKNNKILFCTLLVFISFLLISYFVPLTGDDWTNANFRTNNIINIIALAYDKYFMHEGRFMSRIFVMLFTNTKWIWNISNALMISIVYYISIKLIKPKNILFTSSIYLLSMFLIENTAFTQSYLWVTGNATYFLPLFLFLLYIYLIRKVFDNQFNFDKRVIIISIIINLLVPTMVEHISVALVCANILLLLYSKIKNKIFNKLFIVNSVISIIGFLIIYLSPGAHARANEMAFSHYSLIKKVLVNIPNFINFTFISNTILIILLSMLIVLFINKHSKGIKKIIAISLISIIPILTIINNLLSLIYERSSKARFISDKISYFVNPNNIVTILFWFFIIIVLIIINIDHIKKTDNYKAIFFFIVGLIANIAMLLSPIWGGRTALFTIILLTINILILFEDYNFKISKLLSITISICSVSYLLLLIILYNSVYRQQKNREEMIKEQLDSKNEVITIERFPEDVLWNSNAWNEFHENSFKKYYGIPSDTKIERIKIRYKYYIWY